MEVLFQCVCIIVYRGQVRGGHGGSEGRWEEKSMVMKINTP